ncbi:CesD/SycD/LcrH family type III secretion system chaperone [Burkholderia lata]|uniref:CesD/SycD/LcrH family type III secretion system chaperone n=1 Tax=Burkholderia lata (strain ATCC 17760 / DSM 23089 / LMG 22485 / NCIMB 9086 / R18194 / 383) TaxID=482957 RepID=UPI0015819AB4|nr:CesD/SycD/LcrH family type III secretion system chaperone [Burkholderia lata]
MQDDLDTSRDFFAQGGTTQALMNLNPADLDQVYAYACRLYDSSDYAAAKRFSLLLSCLSHWQFDYWLARGQCCQRLGEHPEAAFSFGQAGPLRFDDPRPACLAGLSYQLSGQRDKGPKAFSIAITLCTDKPEYAALRAKIVRYPLSRKETTP